MPRAAETRRRGLVGVFIELPPDVVAALDELKARAGRSRTAEILHAIQRHLSMPPVVRIEAAPLPEVEVVRKEKLPRRRAGKQTGGAQHA